MSSGLDRQEGEFFLTVAWPERCPPLRDDGTWIRFQPTDGFVLDMLESDQFITANPERGGWDIWRIR